MPSTTPITTSQLGRLLFPKHRSSSTSGSMTTIEPRRVCFLATCVETTTRSRNGLQSVQREIGCGRMPKGAEAEQGRDRLVAT